MDSKKPNGGIYNPLAKTEQTTPASSGWGQPAPTWPADNSDLDEGSIRPSGVGLRHGEILALDAIAEKYDIARNALLRYAARRLILDYRAGRLDLSGQAETKAPRREPRRRLKMPR